MFQLNLYHNRLCYSTKIYLDCVAWLNARFFFRRSTVNIVTSPHLPQVNGLLLSIVVVNVTVTSTLLSRTPKDVLQFEQVNGFVRVLSGI